MPTPKRMRRHAEVGQPRSSTARVAGSAKRCVLGGRRARRPSCRTAGTAWAPGGTWARRKATAMSASRAIEAVPQVGRRVHERLHPGEGARRPALDQVARHGERRPAKPISATPLPDSSAATQPDRLGDVGSVGLRARAGAVGPGRPPSGTGRATTGPRPAPRRPRSRPHGPAPRCRRTGSPRPRRSGGRVAGSARPPVGDRAMAARMLPAPRAARYSGSDRPAWRMNHTGVRDTGCPRQAAGRGAASPAPASGPPLELSIALLSAHPSFRHAHARPCRPVAGCPSRWHVAVARTGRPPGRPVPPAAHRKARPPARRGPRPVRPSAGRAGPGIRQSRSRLDRFPARRRWQDAGRGEEGDVGGRTSRA